MSAFVQNRCLWEGPYVKEEPLEDHDWADDRWRYFKLALTPLILLGPAAYIAHRFNQPILVSVGTLLTCFLSMLKDWLMYFAPCRLRLFEDRITISGAGRIAFGRITIRFSDIRLGRVTPALASYRITLQLCKSWTRPEALTLYIRDKSGAEQLEQAFNRSKTSPLCL